MPKIVQFIMAPNHNVPQPNGRYQYFNRELSWLAFNRRVLDQAFSEKYPLLERIRFLSFVSSNLDQFYEIRVAGIMQQVDADAMEADATASQHGGGNAPTTGGVSAGAAEHAGVRRFFYKPGLYRV